MRSLITGFLLLASLSAGVSDRILTPAMVAARDDALGGATAIYNSSTGPVFTLPQWTDAGGWSAARYYLTIQLSDINGDGSEELLARTPNGMTVHAWDDASGLWKIISDSGPFPDSSGWGDAPEYYETIHTADIDGDGSAELLGRSSVGMDTYAWTGSAWTMLKSGSPGWGDSTDWFHPSQYKTIKTGDINGDGSAELLGRSTSGIDTYTWTGSDWTLLKSASPGWKDDNGWANPEYYTTIQTGDVDGDGSVELLARAADGIDAYAWSGADWTLLKSGSPGWSDHDGWNRPEYYATIQTADIDGDGAVELLGRSSVGLINYKWNGTDWVKLAEGSPAWDDKNGWNELPYYGTMQPADINGDAADELLIRSSAGIDTWRWDGTQWSPLATSTPALSDAHWYGAANYRTIQHGDIDGDGMDELIARGPYGIRTWAYNTLTADNWNHPTGYGFAAFAGDQLTAYNFIGVFLTLASGEDIRGQYTTDANTLRNYQECLFTGSASNQWNDWTDLPTETCSILGSQTAITPPPDLPLEDWNTVAQQIYGELGAAQSVSDYFDDLRTLYTGIFSDNENILTSTAQTLYGEDMSEKKVSAALQNLFLSPFKLGPLGGPAVSAITATASALISAGLASAAGDRFQGKWSEAQSEYTTLTEKNKDAINGGHAFVAGDAMLLTYVAEQKTSGVWNPADPWVTRYTTSEGRKQFALWVFQTLSPAIWEVNEVSFKYDSECTAPKEEMYNYFIGDNKKNDCYREMIEKGTGFPIIYKYASKDNLKTILDAVSADCTPTMSNTATWEYGSCTLGVDKVDLYLNRGGWDFKTVELCEDCAPPPPVGLDMLPGSPNDTITLSQPGHVHVVIPGNASFDATTVLPGSLLFAGASPVSWWANDDDWHPSKPQDLNGDGYLDVVIGFLNQDIALMPGDILAILSGSTNDGSDFKLIIPVTVVQGP